MTPNKPFDPHPISRRQVLQTTGAGFGYLALAGLLGQQAAKAQSAPQVSPAQASAVQPKPPHFPVKAKRVIFLFMEGAQSQMDTFE